MPNNNRGKSRELFVKTNMQQALIYDYVIFILNAFVDWHEDATLIEWLVADNMKNVTWACFAIYIS